MGEGTVQTRQAQKHAQENGQCRAIGHQCMKGMITAAKTGRLQG